MGLKRMILTTDKIYVNMHKKHLLKIIILLFVLIYTNNNSQFYAQTSRLNTNPNKFESLSASPLFDISSIETSNENSLDDPNWANNPFFKKEKPVIPQQKSIAPQTPELSLYEYTISAIWSINDNYKALISGHIVKPGDQINEVKIKKITKNLITVERKNKVKSFRLGFTFYDFQI